MNSLFMRTKIEKEKKVKQETIMKYMQENIAINRIIFKRC